MSLIKVAILTLVTMVAFAGNSLLCRLALRATHIDAASFTFMRLSCGALMLWLIVRLRSGSVSAHGSWLSAFALFTYAAGFSFAYLSLPAAAGALILFGAVQATMIGYGLWRGERLRIVQASGLLLACAGLIGLLSPGLSAPPLEGSLLMIVSGIAWGAYSIRGRGVGDATASTAGNFIRAVPFAVVVSLLMLPRAAFDLTGAAYAALSGAVASGLGYSIWYSVLPHVRATNAATIQLSVPIIAALGGVAFLQESITMRLILASIAVLGGIALVILGRGARE